MSRFAAWMPLVVVATVIGLGLAMPEKSSALRLEARGDAGKIELVGPPGLECVVLTSERFGPYLIAGDAVVVVVGIPIEGSTPVATGAMPASGKIDLGDFATSFSGRDVFVQVVALTAGAAPADMLVSNLVAIVRSEGAKPRVVSARRYALERDGATLAAALAAAGALSALLALRRRPAFDPRRWAAVAAIVGAGAGVVSLVSARPHPFGAFRSVEAKFADAFEPEIWRLVERMRSAETRSARALAIVHYGDPVGEREILAARMLAPRMVLDVLMAPPVSFEKYGLVVVAGDFPAPPGFRETARGRRFAVFETEPR